MDLSRKKVFLRNGDRDAMSALSFLPSFLSRSLPLFFVCWTQAHSLKVFQMISNITVKLSRRWSSSIRVRSAAHFSSCFSYWVVCRRGENFSHGVGSFKENGETTDAIPISKANHIYVCNDTYTFFRLWFDFTMAIINFRFFENGWFITDWISNK